MSGTNIEPYCNLRIDLYVRYQSDLPKSLSARKYLRHSELVKLMTWKLTVSVIPYAQKFLRYVNFADYMVIYGYSENLIREKLLVCNNYRFVTVHNT